MIGCEYRKHCWMVDIDCFFTRFEYCRSKDTAKWLMEDQERLLNDRYNRTQEDFKLQMLVGCI